MADAFEVTWSEEDLEPLRAAWREYVWPHGVEGSGWDLGCDPDFLRRFGACLGDDYDVERAAADLNRHPQVVTTIDGVRLHAVHLRSGRDDAVPLLLLHGWPGSHYEFWPALDLLAASVDPAFDLVVPSLPGYGFSGPIAAPMGPKAVARHLHELMRTLGYDRYLLQGTDWGVVIAPWLAEQEPESVLGLHLDNLAVVAPAQADATDEESLDWRRRNRHRHAALGGYFQLQSTRPQSLAYAMEGKPVAQAAWILERFHDWSDLGGREVDEVYGMDTLVTAVLLYLLTGTFTTSTWMYLGAAQEKTAVLPGRLEVPTGYAAWPEPRSAQPTRSIVERNYDLVHWSVPERGGHFPPTEQPEVFAADLCAWAHKVLGRQHRED